ncbi:hypothetical protein P280DRAFT_553574 [Massarina eburnea CBS 473.64]|uniref:Uncharacterized protein n=1 Tax=Massarina eburnea CBS 473.64 TaxID=1395130 RepID=A0A6A6RKL4_9PLEO|nr:hypothetical protein P280DRAFT_553574 [Massarina eburnea CBS 473.64]
MDVGKAQEGSPAEVAPTSHHGNPHDERTCEMDNLKQQVQYLRNRMALYEKTYGVLSENDVVRDNKTALGSPLDPVVIRTPIQICSGRPLTIKSASEISIFDPVRISCTVPVTIEPLWKNEKATVSLCSDINSDFVQGWNKLPDELRVRILGSGIRGVAGHWIQTTLSSSIHEGDFVNGPLVIDDISPARLWKYCLFPYLKMTPEIATLSKEIYYKTNIFHIGAPRTISPRMRGLTTYLRYPSPAVNHYIRNIRMSIDMSPSHWKFLERLAGGAYGFANVNYVQVNLRWSPDVAGQWLQMGNDIPLQNKWEDFVRVIGNGVNFSMAGEVVFHDVLERDQSLMDFRGLKTDMEGEIRGKIRFSV